MNAAPEEPDVLYELATLLDELDLGEEGYPLLVEAVKHCPVDPGMVLQLGLADMERGDLLAAQRNITQAKHLDPGDRRIDLALQELALRRSRPVKKRRRAA
jgi:CRISPR/Cas system-associated exonuclease Cas4 (RecB family)